MTDNSYTDILLGTAIAPIVDGVNAFSSAIDVTLTAGPDSPIAKIQEATFTTTSKILFLPDARLFSTGGPPVIVINKGTNAFTLKDNAGTNTITMVGAGDAYFVYCNTNTTQAGTWSARQLGIGGTATIAEALAGFGLEAITGQLAVNATAIAGSGLVPAGGDQSALNVNVDNSTLEINADTVRVKALGITNNEIANSTITLGKLDPSVSVVSKFTGSSTGLTSGGTLTIATAGIPATNARYNRFVQVAEETAGGPATDTTWDFDLADRTNYDVETSTPAATITPSDNGNSTVTYSQPTIDYGTTITMGNVIETAPGSSSLNYILPLNFGTGTNTRFVTRSINWPGATGLYPVAALAESTPTTPGVFTGIANDQFTEVVKLSSNKFIRTTNNTTTPLFTLESFNVSTAGNYTTIGNVTLANNYTAHASCRKSDTEALTLYIQSGSTTTLRARIVTVPDGSAPTFGSEQTTATTAPSDLRLAQTDTDKFVLTYTNGTTLYGRILTISGTTITFGAETVLSTATTSYVNNNVAALGTTSFVSVGLAFNAGGPNRVAREIAADFSGTTITVRSTVTLGDSTSGSQTANVIRINSTRALVFYHNSTSGGPVLAVRDYSTITAPTTAVSSTLAAPTTRQNPALGFDSVNNIIYTYYFTTGTSALTYVFNYDNVTPAFTTLATTQDLGYDLSASSAIFNTSYLGKVISGNSGYVRVTDFTQQASGGTAISSAGTPANAFDDNSATVCSAGVNGWVGYDYGTSQTTRIAGLRINATGNFNLIIEASTDLAFTSPVVIHTPGVVRLTASQIYWFDISAPTSLRYVRFREQGGATFTVQDMYFNFGTSVRVQTAYVNFASLAAITSGNWTLASTVFTNSGIASDASDTGEVLITTNNSDIDTGNWEDVDSLTPITETVKIKNQTYSYVLGRGTPVTSSNLYGVEPGQYLYSDSIRSAALGRYTDTKFLQVYSNNTSLLSRLITLSGSTATASSSFTIGANTTNTPTQAIPLDSTRMLVLWDDGGTTKACVILETSGSLSAGSVVSVSGANCNGNFAAALDSTDRVLLFGRISGTDTNLTARVLTISGTTITAGTVSSSFDTCSSSANNAHTLDLINTNKHLACYERSGSTQYRAVVLTVNTGTNTVTGGTPITVDSISPGTAQVLAVGTDKAITVYGANAAAMQARVITVSGTTPTAQTAVSLGINGGNPAIIYKADNSNVFAGINGSTLYWLKISGNTVFNADNSLIQGSMRYLSSAFSEAANNRYPVCILSSGQVIMSGYDTGGGIRLGYFNYADWSPSTAFSFDARNTWRIWQIETAALRNIASNLNSVHGGTNGVWYYQNASDVWVAASINSQRQALKEAFSVVKNRTPAGFYTQLTDANWNTFGWAKSATGTIDLAVSFDATNSELSQLTWNYTSRSQWNMMAEDAYRRNLELETQVTITKLTGGSSNIQASVLYPT